MSKPATVPETTYKSESTSCYSCPYFGPCEAFLCSAGKDTCLSTMQVLGDTSLERTAETTDHKGWEEAEEAAEDQGNDQSVFRRNGSCVAPKDCQPQFYSLSYGYQLRAWVRVTCCSGNCSEPPRPETLPRSRPSDVLCPICSPYDASCDENLYVRCFQEDTTCVNMTMFQPGGGPNVTIQGCGSENLCQLPENHVLGLDYQLRGKPNCNSIHQAVLGYKCQHNAATCSFCGALLPALLGLWMATWFAQEPTLILLIFPSLGRKSLSSF
ncbi:uncharacterized protein LOC118836375 [Trichosurus vulpecula]|uniref:uncharacterized protein LOC118836375 n=1 Tax=Trichosurus vulpecula TaxID=9337 RepID=UPI00186B3521|nr:uncharacterized protein LOC118836375 [Trichosurus vulpecula]